MQTQSLMPDSSAKTKPAADIIRMKPIKNFSPTYFLIENLQDL